jgi:hypothetical protein
MGLDPNKVGIGVNCEVCRKQKRPIGRSVPLEMAMDLCSDACDGFYEPPYSGSLWPGESEADFGHMVGTDGTEIKSPATVAKSATVEPEDAF